MSSQQRRLPGKYKRFVIEVEIEAVDAEATAAFNTSMGEGLDDPDDMDLSQGEDAELMRAVGGVVSRALGEHEEAAGFRPLGSSTFARYVDDEGNYLPVTLPAAAGRGDDGTRIGR